jgi:hypothetical protein
VDSIDGDLAESTRTNDTDQQLSDVIRDTTQIRHHTQQLAESNQQISDHTRQIAESLSDLRETFQAAARTGGIISDPQSAGEVYHNARLYESIGNQRQARNSYIDLFRTGADYVDVHQNFQQLLRLQEGPAGAREVYRGLPGDANNTVRLFASALLEELPERERQLERIFHHDPSFAPAAYELSRCASRLVLGSQTLYDKAREKQWLTVFFELVDRGQFLVHFLDPSAASTMVSDAQQRQAALQSFDASAAEKPVDLLFSRFDRGWNVNVQIKETPREIFYRLDAKDELRSTGFTDHVDPQTQQRYPLTLVSLPAGTGACEIEVAYTDLRGVRRGPFSVPFDPAAALLVDAKRELGYRTQSWVLFGRGDHQDKINFHYLARFKNVISDVRYAVDEDVPTHPFELPDLEHPTGRPATLTVPPDARFVVVQLTFVDGTKSAIARIDR